MGTYALFSTGFEYFFENGTQTILDILQLRGTVVDADSDECLCHRWSLSDKDHLLYMLSQYETALELPQLQVEIFGTDYARCEMFINTYIDRQNPLHLRYLLGCLIYLQLSQTKSLWCVYD